VAVRTLIVEDEPVTQRLLALRLEHIGCAVVGAADNPRDGLSRFRELHPDLVTLDIQMPEFDGLDAAGLFDAIRSEDPRCEIAVITASAFPAHRERFLKAGAIVYERKPVDFRRLADQLRKYFPDLQRSTLSPPRK
jgi:CheY-like chemotaxis protein